MAKQSAYGSVKVPDSEADLPNFTIENAIESRSTIVSTRTVRIVGAIFAQIGTSLLIFRSTQIFGSSTVTSFENVKSITDKVQGILSDGDVTASVATLLTEEVGYASFEGITTTGTFTQYDTGSAMGPWSLNGTAYITNKKSGAIKFSTPTPNGLSYSCLLQCSSTRVGQQPTTSIKTNFADLVIGSCYSVSFYNSLRLLAVFQRIPTTFNVNLGGNSVYSTIPSSTSWVQVTTSVISAVSTSINLEFQISSRIGLDGDLGLDGVTLLKVACPTDAPTPVPTAIPSTPPSAYPTPVPTAIPSTLPSAYPTLVPTAIPSTQPSAYPTPVPTAIPSTQPSAYPTPVPTDVPTTQPTAYPTPVVTPYPTGCFYTGKYFRFYITEVRNSSAGGVQMESFMFFLQNMIPYYRMQDGRFTMTCQVYSWGYSPYPLYASNLRIVLGRNYFYSTLIENQVLFVFDQPVTMSTYSFLTAPNNPGRDPKSWTLSYSQDGKNYSQIDSRTNYQAPLKRLEQSELFYALQKNPFLPIPTGPTASPTPSPTTKPSAIPSAVPTSATPSAVPTTARPSVDPTPIPSAQPTLGGYTGRYFKFFITRVRNGQVNDGVQMENFYMYFNNVLISYTNNNQKCIVTSLGSSPSAEGAQNLVKNDNQKWFSFQTVNQVIFTFDNPITMNMYQFQTANDFPARDPQDWTFSYSNDGKTYSQIDSQTGYNAPLNRFANSAIFTATQKNIFKITADVLPKSRDGNSTISALNDDGDDDDI